MKMDEREREESKSKRIQQQQQQQKAICMLPSQNNTKHKTKPHKTL